MLSTHLPQYSSYLVERLKQPLPGPLAHMQMAPHEGRLHHNVPQHAKQAAVLILLYPHDQQVHTVFISRTRHQNDVHSGQISFPGGRQDPSDLDLEDCALRETKEEIGLATERSAILGRLSPLYIPVSNFLVTPMMAALEEVPDFTPEPLEVQSILPIPMEQLLDERSLASKDMVLSSGRVIRKVPYFAVGSQVIWGATAMILSECLQLIREHP